MNEWLLVAIVIAGTILALGGGAWVAKVLRGGSKQSE